MCNYENYTVEALHICHWSFRLLHFSSSFIGQKIWQHTYVMLNYICELKILMRTLWDKHMRAKTVKIAHASWWNDPIVSKEPPCQQTLTLDEIGFIRVVALDTGQWSFFLIIKVFLLLLRKENQNTENTARVHKYHILMHIQNISIVRG